MSALVSWHASRGSGGQGLVICDASGRTVAVAYAEADAPVLAASPKLFAALERLSLCVAGMDQFSLDEDFEAAQAQAKAAIAEAKGTHEQP